MLADGTLAPEREAEVRAAIAASPELGSLYERERRVAELLSEARRTERAPQSLRVRIEQQRQSYRPRARRPIIIGTGLVGALAAIVLALVLALPGGAPGAPSVSQAAALSTRGAVAPAPLPDPSNPAVKLSRGVGEIYFPNWSGKFGWRAVGQRSDTIGGRRAITVYYDWHGKRLAYTIVAAPALSEPKARVTTLNGTALRTLTLDGRLVVTWRRARHTCVLSAAGVSASVLRQLAAWNAPGLQRP